MPSDKFQKIQFRSKGSGPVVSAEFEIFRHNQEPIKITKKFFYDSGNESGLLLPKNFIDEYQLTNLDLTPVNLRSPGITNSDSFAIYITIHAIKLDNKNILSEPLNKIPLIFGNNIEQMAIIGETVFQNFKCCVDYVNKTLTIE
jgi:hypothetical protein